jgi:uncharacterized protein (TIGR03000 family)
MLGAENGRAQSSGSSSQTPSQSDRQSAPGQGTRRGDNPAVDQFGRTRDTQRDQDNGNYGQANDSKARLLVIVPPDARVFVDDQPTRQMGFERLFISPPLEQGTYTYTVRVTWMQNGREMSREKKVKVQPDQLSRADFVAQQGAPGQYGSDQTMPGGRSEQQQGLEQNRQNFDQNRRTPEQHQGLGETDQQQRTGTDRQQRTDRQQPRTDSDRQQRPETQSPTGGQLQEGAKPGHSFSGTIVRAENHQLIVKLDTGEQRTFNVPADARIMADGQKTNMQSLKAGMQVSITTNADNAVSTIEAGKSATNPK